MTHNCDGHHAHCHTNAITHASIRTYKDEIQSFILLIAGIVLNTLNMFEGMAQAIGVSDKIILVAYYIITILLVGKNIFSETLKSWTHLDFFNEFSLMVLACVGAFIIGEYPEGVAILLFYSFGEKLEKSASDRTKARIRSLLKQIPNTVRVLENDGHIENIQPENVKIGDVIIVRPGERVSHDGIMENIGFVSFDNSAMTGESLPITIAHGQEVNSGALPLSEEVRIKVTKSYKDSSMNRILEMIEDAASKKSTSETLLRRITRWYTPMVMILATLVFIVPFILSLILNGFTFDWRIWFERALVLLVCSCPCALVVSIPLSYFAAIGNASRFGLLIKGSRYLDTLRNVDTILLDKTGTLTTGKFSIDAIIPAANITKEELLQTAAAIEKHSTHPLAIAITAKAGDKLPIATDVKIVPHGMTGMINMRKVIVGSKELLTEHGFTIANSENSSSEVHVAVDNRYYGVILLDDTLKPGVADTITKLHSLGIKNIMILSGDNRIIVEKVAREIGVDSYRAHLLPKDKYEIVQKLKENGHKIVFVGDGINDAPSLTLADVGIAIGTGGTDMAMDSADGVLMGNNINSLVKGLKLSHKVKRIVTENVSFAIFVKLLIMVLGACGIATLWAAVFADTGITLITILWTLFCLRHKNYS